MVISHFQETTGDTHHQDGFAIFFCDQHELQSLETSAYVDTCNRALLQQLCGSLDGSRREVMSLWQELDAIEFGETKPTSDTWLHLLLRAAGLLPRITLIIDALDRVSDRVLSELFETIQLLASVSGSVLKVFLASRDNLQVRRFVKAHATAYELNLEHWTPGFGSAEEHSALPHRYFDILSVVKSMWPELTPEARRSLTLKSEGV